MILTFAGDPQTTMAVTWRTDTTVPHALRRDGPGHRRARLPRPRPAGSKPATEPLTHAARTAHYHSVVFEGLEPGTLYAYRVGDGVNWSEFFQFRTAPAQNQPFTFIYFGDAQNDIKSLWSRRDPTGRHRRLQGRLPRPRRRPRQPPTSTTTSGASGSAPAAGSTA